MKILFLILMAALFAIFFYRGDQTSKEAAVIQDDELDYVQDLKKFAKLYYATSAVCALVVLIGILNTFE